MNHKDDDHIETPPLWEIAAASLMSLLALFGGFCLIMMCVGYVWEMAV